MCGGGLRLLVVRPLLWTSGWGRRATPISATPPRGVFPAYRVGGLAPRAGFEPVSLP